MTFGEAAAALQALDPELARQESVDAVGRQAARLLEEQWPVDSGRSAEAWDYDGAVVNPVPYTSHVHDGLASSLVPAVLAELDPLFAAEVARRLPLE